MSDFDNESTTLVTAAKNVDDIVAFEKLITFFRAGH
jgi:hypothetical protein